MKNVTVVTCYYEFSSKYPCDTYMTWAKDFFKVICNSVVFCDKHSESILLHNVPHIKNNNTLINLDICDFTTSIYDWSHDFKIDPEKSHHSIELYKLWNEKIHFVNRAIELNPYNSANFIWLDIGSFRNSKRVNDIIKYQFPLMCNFPSGKTVLFQIDKFKDIDKQNVKELDNRFLKCNRLSGLFAGDIEGLKLFKNKHSEILYKFKEKRLFSGKDQTLYNFLGLQYPEIFHIVDAKSIRKDYSPWFNIHYYFSLYCAKYLTIHLRGGLGNQLFQICTVLTFANKYGYVPVFQNIKKTSKLRKTYWDRYIHNVKLIDTNKFDNITNVVNESTTNFTELSALRCDCKLKGFFQNTQYLNKSLLKSVIGLNASDEKIYNNKYKSFIENNITLGIHVRRGDYLDSNYYVKLTKEYYEKAYTLIKEKIKGKIKVFIFSDDIEWCKTNFTYITESVHYVNEDDYMEHFILRNMANLIIANSTFSWWAAYLNDNHAQVICPKYWLTNTEDNTELVKNLYVPSWRYINV